jgi:hypothetical protein
VSWQLGRHEQANEYGRQFLAEGRREIEEGLIAFFAPTQAWFLVTWPEVQLRDADEAINLIQRLLKEPDVRSGDRIIADRVLTVAHFRKSNWDKCITSADKTIVIEGFAVAMALWHSGERDQAKACFQESDSRMDKEFERYVDLRFGTEQLRAEAEELMGIAKEASNTAISATEAEK